MKLKVLVQSEQVGGFSVSIPALPGCHSQGDSIEEALTNIREAAELWAEVQVERAAKEAQQESSDVQLQDIEL